METPECWSSQGLFLGGKIKLELAQRTAVDRWRGGGMAPQLMGKVQKHRLAGNKLVCLEDEDWDNIENGAAGEV